MFVHNGLSNARGIPRCNIVMFVWVRLAKSRINANIDSKKAVYVMYIHIV